jgi:uncharacterized membrane protein YeaQ/YmgE (transglycosylase-associated protein family)
MDTRALAVMLVVGLLAGWLASFVVGGSGLLRYILTGVIGSFVGGFVLRGFAIQLGIKNELLNQIVTASIGAVIVVVLARILA